MGAVLLALACLAPWQADAAIESTAPAADKAGDSKQVVLAADRNYPPLTFIDQNGRPSGFDIQLFQAIAAEAGLTPQFELREWHEALLLFQARQVDVVPMFVTRERAQHHLFSDPILRRYHLVFGRKGGRYVTSLDELEGRRVAMQFGRITWDELQGRIPPVRLIPQESEAEAVLAVAQGKAEYALVPAAVGYESITRHKLDQVVALSPPVLEGDYAFAISPSRPELVPLFNAALRKVKASGTHDQLYLDWLANLRPEEESYRSGLLAGAWIALPLLATTLLVYVWWRRAQRHATKHYERAETEARLRQEAQERIEYLAFHDLLTGLPNRNALQRELEQGLQEVLRQGSECLLARIDLMDMDLIQTVAGQGVYNQVIQATARRLEREFGSKRVAHFGRGDFAVLIGPAPDLPQPTDVARWLQDIIQERGDEANLDLEPQCRVGLTLFPGHATDAEGLMRRADMACAAAHKHNVRVMIYDPCLEPDPRNLTLLSDLQQALRDGTLGYALQPKLSLNQRKYCGAEMLVRWTHPRYGPLSPAQFVPLAERTGLVGDMTLYLVRKAIAHCREWEAQGLDMTLSVNVSVNDLAQLSLVDVIVAEAEGIGQRLMLEVTETDVMRDTDQVMEGVRRLRTVGIRISIDDFGTGHASLTYLQRMAPNEIKIDRSFITNLLEADSDRMIVRTSIQLAHELGATVTAEGIEDEATLQWLAAAGCDMAQGFGIARPMAETELRRSEQLRYH